MNSTEITERRQLDIAGGLHWTVNVFDHGRRYMLVATADNGTQFTAQFDAEQWAEFQKLVQPS